MRIKMYRIKAEKGTTFLPLTEDTQPNVFSFRQGEGNQKGYRKQAGTEKKWKKERM